MFEGTKLDPPFINALVERWKLETYTFHLPWGECGLTLTLQLSLPVDGEVVTGLVVSAGSSAICKQLLGKLSNKFRVSRIEMGWLKDNFQNIEAYASDVEKKNSHAYSS
ncbi:hypothetical protein PVK06_033887 [Gossypium arboreum]|uniref:Aminotransferase-like plant mobile domain-containing protein n=1 Tax=Gossypium arboreum TaxID=29729 RepID=A0ABR0NEU8_GOSAR|nr:hypothetical protein PVK06_033887 [Gossypium arboreum]